MLHFQLIHLSSRNSAFFLTWATIFPFWEIMYKCVPRHCWWLEPVEQSAQSSRSLTPELMSYNVDSYFEPKCSFFKGTGEGLAKRNHLENVGLDIRNWKEHWLRYRKWMGGSTSKLKANMGPVNFLNKITIWIRNWNVLHPTNDKVFFTLLFLQIVFWLCFCIHD